MQPSLAPVCPQNISFKDKRVQLQSKEDLVAVKEEARCDSEAQALKEVRPLAWGCNSER